MWDVWCFKLSQVGEDGEGATSCQITGRVPATMFTKLF